MQQIVRHMAGQYGLKIESPIFSLQTRFFFPSFQEQTLNYKEN